MPPRASWKGYLKLSLVSCAVALYPANTTSERVSFHQLNRATGNRLKQQMIDGETGEVVERDERAKGYEVGKGEYLVMEDEELDKVEIESNHTIEIERFVPRAQVDPVYLSNSHYMAPEDKVAQEAFGVIREAMRERNVVGIGRVVLFRRERMLMLDPRGKGLLASTLRYNYEVRDDTAYFQDIPDIEVPDDMRDLAIHIIDRKAGDFDPAAFEDRYENALVELIRAKQAGRTIEPKRFERPSNVVNLMDALRRSIETEKGEGAAPKRKPAASSQKRAGKAASEPKAKAPTRKAAGRGK